ncbi:peptidylprolyl isomerase [Vampirovibrio chlorellavorus]|uniref:peptidylprolyl isomerase n=1 Tax=Vampirovibrio chlorellavorus TaxID=758823 RepID=UPI0026EC9D9A|nr:peptidylprolyl isomerase [Vampirovibrio chlorellavorus]
MKRVFQSSSRTAALTLAVSLALGSTSLAHADWMQKMNPMKWIPAKETDSQTNEVNQSTASQQQSLKQEADAASAQADQALRAAQEALQKAQEAKRKAEALKIQAEGIQKPVVQDPAETSQQSDNQATEENTADSQSNSPSKAWYKLGLSSNKKQTSASQTEAGQSQTSQPEESATSSTQSNNTEQAATTTGTPWNPLSWFSKPTDSSAATNTAPQALSAVVETASEVRQIPDLKTKAAILETEKGNIVFELFPDEAPLTVQNFAKLVQEGFYNRFNMKFHRVVPGFVIQTGDPTGTGAGGSKERVPLEAKNKLSHNAKGMVAMARGADPNSATSQFYITLAPQTTLDGKYAIFGKVIAGMDVLDKIEKDNMLYGIRLVDLDKVVRDPSPDKKKFFSSLF